MWSKWAEFSVQSSNHLNNILATLVMSVWGTDIIKTHLKMGMNLNLFCKHKRTKWAWGFLNNLITPMKYACKHIDRNWIANVATLKTCFGSLDCTKQHDACLYPSGSGELTIIKNFFCPSSEDRIIARLSNESMFLRHLDRFLFCKVLLYSSQNLRIIAV